MIAFKIEIIAQVGYMSDLSYFQKYPDALKELRKLIKEEKIKHKADCTLAKTCDVPDGSRNGAITLNPKRSPFDDNVLCEATVYFWQRVSYEYEDEDVYGNTYRISKIEIQ